MITIKSIKKSEENGMARISVNIRIKDNDEVLWIDTTKEYEKYFVTDRADAFIVGILLTAMINGQDIVSEQPISSQLKFTLEHQLIPTLAKYDGRFYRTCILSEVTDEPIQNEGAVGTGISLGLDSFCTIADAYNTDNKGINLTHLVTFNRGIVGGSYHENNLKFCSDMLFSRIEKVSAELQLPLICMNTNLHSYMVKYMSPRVDFFSTYWLIMMIMSLGKLFKMYYISSTGIDFTGFKVKKMAYEDCEEYDLLTLYCCSTANGVRFVSGGGEKSRFEKVKTICDFEIARKNLMSCLYEHFNCMHCAKCKRNLVTIDALGRLEDFRDVYDIDYYKNHRNRYLEWMCQQVQMGSHAALYIGESYEIIKSREPDLINKLTLSGANLFFNRNELQRQRDVYRTFTAAFQRALETPNWENRLREWFSSRGIHDVVVYGYGIATTLLIHVYDRIDINIVGIVCDNTKDVPKKYPTIRENSVSYPQNDAVIISNVETPDLIKKKLAFFVKSPIYSIIDVIALK